MKKLFGLRILIFSLLFFSIANAQDNIKIGYQEFPTNVTGQASDREGNMYYSGTFKGELTIKGEVLQRGQGLEDLFFVKTNGEGNLVYTRSFGSQSSDLAMTDGLVHFNNSLYFGAKITDAVTFQSFTLAPYQGTAGNVTTGCILSLDTSGTVKWANKTSVFINRIYAADNIIHVTGRTNTGPIRYNNQVLYDSLPSGSMVHLMLDTLGNLLSSKVASPQSVGQSTELLYLSSYSDGNLCELLRVTGNNSFHFGDANIPLPNTANNYYVIVKTDTAYKSFSYKLLNTPGMNFTNDNGVGLTMTLSRQDSIYLVLNSGNPSASINYDGLSNVIYNKNILVVFDSSLKANRMLELGNPIFGAENPATRRLMFRSIHVMHSNLFFTGDYGGANESPVDQIPEKDTIINILPAVIATVDLNGASKSFVAKTPLDFSSGTFSWIGDHSQYESAGLVPAFVHNCNDSLFVLSYRADNVWNPRIIDQNTRIVAGTMMRSADLPDRIKCVSYLPDGSRIILGTAQGLTALDSASSTIKSNQQRTDAFIARISTKGQVLWYKRFSSTLLTASPLKLVVNAGKAYFLVNYFTSVNQVNYITIDQKQYNVSAYASLLAEVDASGNIHVINLENNDVRSTVIVDFNFCSNGDMVLLTGLGSAYMDGSSTSPGPHLLRLNLQTSKFVAARRFVANDPYSFQPANIEVDSNDVIYVSVPLNSAGSAQNQFGTLSLLDGSAVIDATSIENSVVGQSEGGLGILKMNWNKFIWYKRTGGRNLFGISRSYTPAFPVNGKIVFMGHPIPITGTTSGSVEFYWDHQLVVPDMSYGKTYFFRMDTSGKIEMQKAIGDFDIRSTKKTKDGTLLISGSISNATSIDTVAVGYDGNSDAFAFAIDSSFQVKRSYRLASPFSEFMDDIDLYDSLVSYAYTAQTVPVLKPFRTNTLVTDYAADAFLGTQIITPQLALPLRLLFFGAERNENFVNLSWVIAVNEEGKTYTVQRAADGSSFKNIVTIDANKVVGVTSYKWQDPLKENGSFFYRLKLVDLDGKVSYSKVIPIFSAAKPGSFYYENSFEQLHIVRTDMKVYSWKIFELTGRTLLSGERVSGSHRIDVSALPKGTYIIQTIDESYNSQTYKFIK